MDTDRDYFLITGTTKGLGEALAEECSRRGNSVITLSRKKNGRLSDNIIQLITDLNTPEKTGPLMETVFGDLSKKEISSLTLINNAGVLSPIGFAGKTGTEDILKNITVNLAAPMVLSSLFIKRTENFSVPRTIINISSGAGKKPKAGWSCYCAAKAGLDMFTKTAVLEQSGSPDPVKMISFDPGIMDTGMQERIRNTAAEDFPELERFKKFKVNGELLSPAFTAATLLDLLGSGQMDAGGLFSIYDFLQDR